MIKALHLLIFNLIIVFISFNSYSQGLQYYNDSLSYPGYTLFAADHKAYLIDNCGKVVNDWTFNNEVRISTYLMPNGNIFWMGSLTPNTFSVGGGPSGNLEIRDPYNNLVWEYAYYQANVFGLHHDSEVLPNGNVLVIAWEYVSYADAVNLGRDPNRLSQGQLWPTKVAELQPVGFNQANVVWEWHCKDHLIQDYDPGKLNYGVIADNPQLLDINAGGTGKDWLHCNGIDYNADLDQIIISAKHLHEIYVIDHSTTTAEAASHSGGTYGKGGDFLYRWGNPENYDRGTSSDKILDGQHDVRWVRKGFPNQGAITVYNNQGVSNNQSSVEVFFAPMDSDGFYTQPVNNSTAYGPATPDFTYTNGPGGSFHSNIQGGMQGLPNGNFLITEATSQNIFELDHLTGDVVWEYKVPINENIFKAVRYLQSDPEMSTMPLSPGYTIEYPSSIVSDNCGTILYPPFCFINYSGSNALDGIEINTIADYETDGIIESTQSIQYGAIVDYDSNTEIILLPGFEVNPNADFYAIIDGCNFGAGGLN